MESRALGERWRGRLVVIGVALLVGCATAHGPPPEAERVCTGPTVIGEPYCLAVAVSDDGNVVLYKRAEPDPSVLGGMRFAVLVYDRTSSERVEVPGAIWPRGELVDNAVLSPDGETVMFVVLDEAGNVVHHAYAWRSGIDTVTPTGIAEGYLLLSADGSTVVTSGSAASPPYFWTSVFDMRAGRRIDLADTAHVDALSPEGDWLAYVVDSFTVRAVGLRGGETRDIRHVIPLGGRYVTPHFVGPHVLAVATGDGHRRLVDLRDGSERLHPLDVVWEVEVSDRVGATLSLHHPHLLPEGRPDALCGFVWHAGDDAPASWPFIPPPDEEPVLCGSLVALSSNGDWGTFERSGSAYVVSLRRD